MNRFFRGRFFSGFRFFRHLRILFLRRVPIRRISAEKGSRRRYRSSGENELRESRQGRKRRNFLRTPSRLPRLRGKRFGKRPRTESLPRLRGNRKGSKAHANGVRGRRASSRVPEMPGKGKNRRTSVPEMPGRALRGFQDRKEGGRSGGNRGFHDGQNPWGRARRN